MTLFNNSFLYMSVVLTNANNIYDISKYISHAENISRQKQYNFDKFPMVISKSTRLQ